MDRASGCQNLQPDTTYFGEERYAWMSRYYFQEYGGMCVFDVSQATVLCSLCRSPHLAPGKAASAAVLPAHTW